MPFNLELKTKLTNLDETKVRLNRINAEYKGELHQKDVYYSIPAGLLKLRIEGINQTLIKYLRDETAERRFSDYDLLEIFSPNAEEFLGKIFKTEVVVEKTRQLYMYDNTRIHLDEVKGLGSFLELETLVLQGKEDASVRFEKIIELLHLDFNKQIKKSYRGLMKELQDK